MSAFARFVAACGLTNLADGVATIAWAWLATLLTRDPLYVALVSVALRLPWAIFALPAGVITDRVDRRQLILGMDALRALAFAAVALGVWAALPLPEAPLRGIASPGLYALLIIVSLCVGAAEVFRDNTAQTMLPALVPQGDLERANGRLWSVELVGNALVGPALGAVLITLALPVPFAGNALAYLAAVLLVWRLPGRFRPEAGVRNWRQELREGVAFLRGAPLLRLLAVITGLWNLLWQVTMVAMVLHVQENLGLSATEYGLVLAGGAVGGILGGLAGARIVQALGPGRTAQWMLLLGAPCFVAIGAAPEALSLALMLAVSEFTGLVWNTVSVSYRQRMIPNRLLGRVNSLYRLLAWGMIPVGLLCSGLLVRAAETVLPRDQALILPFWVAASGALILSLASWRALGRGFATR